LVGEESERHTVLSAPIILYDYPRIAPESPGDLFDGTEIDQLLMLNILTLTDEEKAEMRASDPRAREILERSESLTAADFMRLHGAIRECRFIRESAESAPAWETLERPAPQSVLVQGTALTKGSKIRLRPRPGGDIFDLALAGKIAVVEAIEQDYEDRIHLAVTLEDDPGRDLGMARQPGQLFFFAPDEVEPLLEDGQ
jgi:hydrogenase maturation protease